MSDEKNGHEAQPALLWQFGEGGDWLRLHECPDGVWVLEWAHADSEGQHLVCAQLNLMELPLDQLKRLEAFGAAFTRAIAEATADEWA